MTGLDFSTSSSVGWFRVPSLLQNAPEALSEAGGDPNPEGLLSTAQTFSSHVKKP